MARQDKECLKSRSIARPSWSHLFTLSRSLALSLSLSLPLARARALSLTHNHGLSISVSPPLFMFSLSLSLSRNLNVSLRAAGQGAAEDAQHRPPQAARVQLNHFRLTLVSVCRP